MHSPGPMHQILYSSGFTFTRPHEHAIMGGNDCHLGGSDPHLPPQRQLHSMPWEGHGSCHIRRERGQTPVTPEAQAASARFAAGSTAMTSATQSATATCSWTPARSTSIGFQAPT